MQAIAVKDIHGETYFLGLDKKAYIAPGFPVPNVDEEWEVRVIESHGDKYIVEPLYKHQKKTYYKIVPRIAKDLVYKFTAVGRRTLSRTHIKTLYAPRDCINLEAPFEIKKQVLINRITWEEKKALMLAIIPWLKKPGLKKIKNKHISGKIYARQSGHYTQNYFIGDGFVFKGPRFYFFSEEEVKIKHLLDHGKPLHILVDTSTKEGFLTNFFIRAKIKCEDVTMPMPEGLRTKKEILKYFKRSEAG